MHQKAAVKWRVLEVWDALLTSNLTHDKKTNPVHKPNSNGCQFISVNRKEIATVRESVYTYGVGYKMLWFFLVPFE